MQRIRTSNPSRGFTLIELMVAMVVSAIVVLGVFAFSSIQSSTSDIHERNVRVQRALAGAMWSVGQDMRSAGIGWARFCTELRVWDGDVGQIINPGGVADPNNAVVDPITGEPYWVLRDGVQVFWSSDGATSFPGTQSTSAHSSSAADAFDVVVAESNYLESTGMFSVDLAGVDTGAGVVTATTSSNLTFADDLDEIQQMFPPGSFVVLVRDYDGLLSVHPTRQGQCVLLQVTADVTSSADGEWQIPIGNSSNFNADLASLLADDADAGESPCTTPGGTGGGTGTGGDDLDCDDWEAEFDSLVPLGRLRWSRYEVDYSIPEIPYLVRYDIIGWQDGDPEALGGVDYPHCVSGSCTAAQLHLPGGDSPPAAVAIGPMVEDMQVAIGCDGYTPSSAGNALFPVPGPDAGFSELDEYSERDGVVDEQPAGSRTRDEWLGNAPSEAWAPDCVYWGTGEYRKSAWAALDPSAVAAHRTSPQTVRVTLTASSEFAEQAGGLSTTTVIAVEDRANMTSAVGARQRFHLTERFTPPNLHWRDPSIQ